MTDDELAEEYIDGCAPCFKEYPKAPRGALRQAFLAGLKARGPVWHDLRKNHDDLPPLDRSASSMSIDVLIDRGEIVYYCFKWSCWMDYDGNKIDSPVAWCKIPEYTEE